MRPGTDRLGLGHTYNSLLKKPEPLLNKMDSESKSRAVCHPGSAECVTNLRAASMPVEQGNSLVVKGRVPFSSPFILAAVVVVQQRRYPGDLCLGLISGGLSGGGRVYL